MTSPNGYGRGSIITPEAVLLDFELAGLGSRSVAYAIDFTVQLVALLVFLMIIGAIGVASPVVALITMLVGLIAIVLGYPVIMETMTRGKTLGRMAVGTRVVTVEGAPIRFRHALIRALLGIVDLLITLGAVAVVTSLLTRRGQRTGDLVAGTMVIRERTSAAPAGAMYFWAPSYLADWAATVDTRALSNDTYQLVRDFLSRPDLSEETRGVMGEELAAMVSEQLPHAARPSTLPARDYLTAIAAAVQGPAAGAMAPPPPVPTQRGPASNRPPPPGMFPRPAPAPPPPREQWQAQPPQPLPSQPLPQAQPQQYPQPQAPGATPPVSPLPSPVGPLPDPPNDGGFTAPG